MLFKTAAFDRSAISAKYFIILAEPRAVVNLFLCMRVAQKCVVKIISPLYIITIKPPR